MPRSGKNPYGYYGVYGSLAYDFRPIGNEKAGDYSGSTAQKRKIKKKSRAGASPALVVSVLLCIVMLLGGILGRSDIVILSEEAYVLRSEIQELISEQTMLKIEHARAFSPEETERYAIEVLGMKKPGAEQIYYIDVSEPYIEASDEETESPAGEILSLFGAYFPG